LRQTRTDATRHGAAALARESELVRAAQPGGRNRSLDRAAFCLGQLVAGGVIGRRTVESTLLAAALDCGLGPREAEATIRSGVLPAGFVRPEELPEAVGLGRDEGGEEGPLVLGQLAEERPEDERGEGVQREAGRETLGKLVARERADAKAGRGSLGRRAPCLLEERSADGVGGLEPDGVREQADELLGPLLEGEVLKSPLDLRPLRTPAGRHVIGVAVQGLVEDRQDHKRPLGTGRGLRDLTGP
jgi:hypothetical protein